MTDRQVYEKISEAFANDPEVMEWVEKKYAQMERRASKRAERKTQKSEADIAALNTVMEILEGVAPQPLTAMEIIRSDETLYELTSQKLTTLLKDKIEAGEVLKSKIKGKMAYAIA